MMKLSAPFKEAGTMPDRSIFGHFDGYGTMHWETTTGPSRLDHPIVFEPPTIRELVTLAATGAKAQALYITQQRYCMAIAQYLPEMTDEVMDVLCYDTTEQVTTPWSKFTSQDEVPDAVVRVIKNLPSRMMTYYFCTLEVITYTRDGKIDHALTMRVTVSDRRTDDRTFVLARWGHNLKRYHALQNSMRPIVCKKESWLQNGEMLLIYIVFAPFIFGALVYLFPYLLMALSSIITTHYVR